MFTSMGGIQQIPIIGYSLMTFGKNGKSIFDAVKKIK